MFCVITKVPDPEKESGNLAAALLYPDPDSEQPKTAIAQLRMAAMFNLRSPVFTLGEILVLDGDDRDYGTTRKPSKWFVECEHCATVEEAIEISRRVTQEPT